jgi:glycosyltransferase involved in cell wall biosynthesis
MKKTVNVFMAGPSESAPGGMSAVIKSYRQAGLFEDGTVRYVSTYDGARVLVQLRTFGRAFSKLLSSLIRRTVDVLHVHSASRGSFWRKSILCLLARCFRVPYVYHLHSGEFPDFYTNMYGGFSKFWVRQTLKNASRVLVLTASWKNEILKIEPTANVGVALNPVDLTGGQHHDSSSGLQILFLGRVREKKGAFDLLRAMGRVTKIVPEAKLLMAGDGEIEKGREICQDIALPPSVVEFLGWIDGSEKDEILSKSDIFVLPSYYEGLPIGILEAMAAGVLVVASNVGGIPDVIRHEENGIIVSPGDIDSLAKELVRLLGDVELRNKLISRARVDVQMHDSTRIVSELIEMYNRISINTRHIS